VPVAVAEKVAVWPRGTEALAGWEVTVGAATRVWGESGVLVAVAPVKLTALQPVRKTAISNEEIPAALTGSMARPRCVLTGFGVASGIVVRVFTRYCVAIPLPRWLNGEPNINYLE